MSGLDAFVTGERTDYGTHTFTPQAIIAFAEKFDPQPFHVDPEAARESIFGALCASGWHTAAVWMKKNLEYRPVLEEQLRAQGLTFPKFGPSPGFRTMKWPKPVFAGDVIRFYNTVTNARPLRSRPGWGIVEMYSEAINQDGDPVMSFDSAALFEL